MPIIDWNDKSQAFAGYKLPDEGLYLMEVERSEEKTGPSGPYFSVLLRGVENTSVVAFDVMSFSGGALPITKTKLLCLGLEGVGDVEDVMLIGRRAVCMLVHDNSGTRPRLRPKYYKPDTAASKTQTKPEQKKPSTATGTKALQEMDDDIPF